MIAATVAAFELIVRGESCLKAEGNMRKLETVQLGSQIWRWQARTYPSIIKSADRVAAALQYHGVWSFSLYRSISVRCGFHLGNDGCPILGAPLDLMAPPSTADGVEKIIWIEP